MNYPVIDVNGTGMNIRNLIERSSYSISQIADYLGATTSLVYRYMNGAVLPSTDRLMAISVLFGVTVNDIVAIS